MQTREALDIQQEAEVVEVMYPWVKGADRFEELKYSLRSLEKYACFPYRVVIVGDLPEWLDESTVTYIPHEQVSSDVLTDAISKMLTYLEKTPDESGFIRMYDDIYFLRPATMEEIMKVKVNYEMHDDDERKKLNPHCCTKYWDFLMDTYRALKIVRPRVWNTESHCPEYFNKVKMSFVLSQFGLPERNLLSSTLYYNYWREAEDGIPCREVNVGFYGKNSVAKDRKKIIDLCSDKFYLNHNDQGANPVLVSYVRFRFREKSRFEK
jgi:hypothetical protein